MVDKTLITFLAIDFVFLCSGALILTQSLVFRNGGPSQADVATTLLFQQTPLTAGMVNAGLIFFTFVLSLPGAARSRNRTLLQAFSWMVIFCATFTLALGLDIWFSTLQTKTNLGVVWAQQTPQMIGSLQQQFTCCGYMDHTIFVTNNICPSPAAAAKMQTCMVPFSAYANSFLDIVFTSLFGICALDGFLFLSAVVVLKSRAETERYRLIDQKSGFGGI